MSAPVVDPAMVIVQQFITALRTVFDPTSVPTPKGGGTQLVRLVYGDGALPSWNPGDGDGCDVPFLWVRPTMRCRTAQFPTPSLGTGQCDALRHMLGVEIGVGRCVTGGPETDWDELAKQAEVSLDDSWRIEAAMCKAAALLEIAGYPGFASDTINPFGPSGLVTAWTGLAYVEY